MAIYGKSGSTTKLYHDSKLTNVLSQKNRIYHDFMLPGTMLWSGNMIFSDIGNPIYRSNGASKIPLKLPKSFSDLRGIRLTFGTAIIVKIYDIGDAYIYPSGSSGGTVSNDGTYLAYPTTATVTRQQLESGFAELFDSSKVKFTPGDYSTWQGPIGYRALDILTDKADSFVLTTPPYKVFTGFDSALVIQNFSTNGADYYYGYPVLTKVEAI